MRRRSSVFLGVATIGALSAMAIALGAASAGCQSRARMCGAPNECGLGQGCVAGRCMPDGGTPAIQNSKRVVVVPVDVAYLRRGDPSTGGALPPIVSLGRASESEAILLLRFDVPLAKDQTVLEAYLLLERTTAIDSDPTPITLHAARILDPWNGRSISWATQPRVEETRSPATTIDPAGGTLVRLDVRELVNHWRRHAKNDQGIAIVAESSSPSGMAFALTVATESGTVETPEPIATATSGFGGVGAASGSEARGTGDLRSGTSRTGPRLELYIKEATVVTDGGVESGVDGGSDGAAKPTGSVRR